jgi:hypothetical protein
VSDTLIIDTCALIDYWKVYDPTHFPSFWSAFEGAILEARIVICEPVMVEIKGGELQTWLKAITGKRICKRSDADIVSIGEITERHYPLVLAGATAPEYADPDIIGIARNRGWVLVTSEARAGGKPSGKKNPKVPDVCIAEGVRWEPYHRLASLMNWKL